MVQVHPRVKRALLQRLQTHIEYDTMLSSFAFDLDLRPYSTVALTQRHLQGQPAEIHQAGAGRGARQGKAVPVDSIKLTSKAPGIKILKLEDEEVLSSFAFKFNLRRYLKENEIKSLFPSAFKARASIRSSTSHTNLGVYFH